MEPWIFAVFQGVYLHTVLLNLSARYCPWNRCEKVQFDLRTTRVAHTCPHSPANLATSRATKSGTSGVLFLGLHVLLATVAPNATRGNHGLLFQGSMCRHNRLKLWCTDGSGSLTSAELDNAATTLHSATFACSVGFHTAISKLKFTCVLSWYGKQTNLSISTMCHTKQSTAISWVLQSLNISLFLGVYVLQAV